MVLLADEEWKMWSDNEVAKRCAVSQPFVSFTRKSLLTVISEPIGERAYYNKIDSNRDIQERLYTTKHGTVANLRHRCRFGSELLWLSASFMNTGQGLASIPTMFLRIPGGPEFFAKAHERYATCLPGLEDRGDRGEGRGGEAKRISRHEAKQRPYPKIGGRW